MPYDFRFREPPLPTTYVWRLTLRRVLSFGTARVDAGAAGTGDQQHFPGIFFAWLLYCSSGAIVGRCSGCKIETQGPGGEHIQVLFWPRRGCIRCCFVFGQDRLEVDPILGAVRLAFFFFFLPRE